MIVDKNIAELVCELEVKIGKQTYNPNSYNGWTGEEGCGYRYPVYYCKNNDDLATRNIYRTKGRIECTDPDCIKTMKYKFGSNHLYVGDGIVAMLNYLEETYDIDFNKLEQKRLEKRKKNLLKINEKLANGKIVKINPGKMVAGIDLPVGKLKIANFDEKNCSLILLSIYNDAYEQERNILVQRDNYEVVDLKEGYYIRTFDSYEIELLEKTNTVDE